jgi:hypothetical protein
VNFIARKNNFLLFSLQIHFKSEKGCDPPRFLPCLRAYFLLFCPHTATSNQEYSFKPTYFLVLLSSRAFFFFSLFGDIVYYRSNSFNNNPIMEYQQLLGTLLNVIIKLQQLCEWLINRSLSHYWRTQLMLA